MAQLLTTAQVAEQANRSLRTVTRWIGDGTLQPVMKLPGRTGSYLFEDVHVAEVIAARTKAAAA